MPARRDAMFRGEPINVTEDRAVLHTALRNRADTPVLVDGAGRDARGRTRCSTRMAAFADGVRDGTIAAADGERFTDVVNIGIGGSDLGPAMATLALAPYHDGPRLHYVSNVDGAHVARHAGGARPGADAGHRRLEDLHHHRDDDQRAHRAGLAAGGARRGGRAAFRRGLDRARQDRGLRHRRGPGLRLLGLGRRALFGLGRGRAAADDRHRAGAVRRVPDRRLRDGPALRRGAAAARTCRCCSGWSASGTATSWAIRLARGAALRPAAGAAAGLPAAARHGVERQGRDARRRAGDDARPGRWSGASRAPTASTPSTS